MNRRSYATRIVASVAMVLVLALSALQLNQAQAQASAAQPSVTIAQLAGTWYATLSGVTGCGTTTLAITFKLDATGNGTQSSSTEHTAACGDINLAGQSAQVQTLNPNGSGFIAFGCGSGCGFGFNFQLSRNLQMFDLSPESVSGNYLAGVAVRR
ncbi:MAG: hypothetical protein JWQ87_1392 [Candidatus Sulfotelmatobacter sp.]|nr:hypothetical protein [Candidatus Sulfotelmatobacter sp.]